MMVGIMMRPNYAKTGLEAVACTVEMRGDDKKLITPQTLFYANPNKKRTQEWLLRSGNSSVPFAVSHPGFIRSIAYESENNNNQGENFPNAENSKAQKSLSLKNVDTDATEQLKNLEKAKGAKHTPFAVEATAAGYEDVPVKVTGFQGNKHVLTWVIMVNPLWSASRCGQVER